MAGGGIERRNKKENSAPSINEAVEGRKPDGPVVECNADHSCRTLVVRLDSLVTRRTRERFCLFGLELEGYGRNDQDDVNMDPDDKRMRENGAPEHSSVKSEPAIAETSPVHIFGWKVCLGECV